MAATPANGRYRDAFASAEFRVVFGSYTVSMLGSVVAAVALTVLVYERSGSSLLAALTFTLAFLPHLIGGALLSSLADGMPPRRLLVLCDAVAAVLVVAMAIPGLPLVVPLVLLVLANLLSPVRGGTRSALLPDILPAEAFVPARSLLRLVAQGSQLAGNAAAAALLLVLSPRQALLIDAASFAASAAVLRLGLQARPARALTRTAGLARDSLAAARTAFHLPGLRAILLFGWLVPAFSVWPEALSAPAVASHGASPAAVGWWLMAIPAGTAIGEVAALWWMSPERRQRLLRVLAAAGFVPFLVFALQPALLPSLLLLVVAGLGSAYIPGADALLLEETPEELRGRVFTLSTAGLMTTQGLGFAASGAVAEVLSPNTTIVLAGIAGLAVVAGVRPRRAAAAAPAELAASAS